MQIGQKVLLTSKIRAHAIALHYNCFFLITPARAIIGGGQFYPSSRGRGKQPQQQVLISLENRTRALLDKVEAEHSCIIIPPALSILGDNRDLQQFAQELS